MPVVYTNVIFERLNDEGKKQLQSAIDEGREAFSSKFGFKVYWEDLHVSFFRCRSRARPPFDAIAEMITWLGKTDKNVLAKIQWEEPNRVVGQRMGLSKESFSSFMSILASPIDGRRLVVFINNSYAEKYRFRESEESYWNRLEIEEIKRQTAKKKATKKKVVANKTAKKKVATKATKKKATKKKVAKKR